MEGVRVIIGQRFLAEHVLAGRHDLLDDGQLHLRWHGNVYQFNRRVGQQGLHRIMHPGDADPLGIKTGRSVRLGNSQGELTLDARVSDAVRPGVVVVEGIWPGDAFNGGRGINLLTSADVAAPCGGAVFHDTAVWVRLA